MCLVSNLFMFIKSLLSLLAGDCINPTFKVDVANKFTTIQVFWDMTPYRFVSGYGWSVRAIWPYLIVQVIILGLLALRRGKNKTLPIILELFTNIDGVTIPEDLNLHQTSLSEFHIVHNRFINSMWFYVINTSSLLFCKCLSVLRNLWTLNTPWFA
jgi:hypothetical protein